MSMKHPSPQGWISIHALHEESDGNPSRMPQMAEISIHALHEESDVPGMALPSALAQISIHALHEESDVVVVFPSILTHTFQSTLSMRRATRDCRTFKPLDGDFNPRSP